MQFASKNTKHTAFIFFYICAPKSILFFNQCMKLLIKTKPRFGEPVVRTTLNSVKKTKFNIHWKVAEDKLLVCYKLFVINDGSTLKFLS